MKHLYIRIQRRRRRVIEEMNKMATNPSNTKPLHYGGSISGKTGQLGQRVGKGGAGGSHFKSRRRLENICRLENAGFTKPQIAAMLVKPRSEEHTSELQSQSNLVCRLL